MICHVRTHMWYLEFIVTQGFNAKRETSRESSSSTLWQDHEARHKSRHEVNMTPSGPRIKEWSCETPRTWTENAEACATRSHIQTTEKLMPRAHMQEVESSRRHEKQAGGSWGRTRPKWAHAGRPSPFRARFGTPFDLDAILTIYSPLAKSHTSIHSSSTAEE
jgi:hypothetical protein